jgi:hypothetical protein
MSDDARALHRASSVATTIQLQADEHGCNGGGAGRGACADALESPRYRCLRDIGLAPSTTQSDGAIMTDTRESSTSTTHHKLKQASMAGANLVLLATFLERLFPAIEDLAGVFTYAETTKRGCA